MIRATFEKKQGSITCYQVIGHANYASHGQDIICAAVSGLYITITNKLLQMNYVYETAKGILVFVPSVQTNLLADTLLDGLKGIEEQYPENIKVEVLENE